MSRLPSLITFTGVDARTDVARACRIAATYPVEFAMLFSIARQGEEPRYPDGDTQCAFLWSRLVKPMRPERGQLAAHLCGEYGRRVMNGERIDPPVDLGYVCRIQVNHPAPDAAAIAKLSDGWGPRCIAQTRADAFPADDRVDWLFDRSGGTGTAPDRWPPHPGGKRLVGYAGGIGPHNVADVIAQVGNAGPYWLDMESGIRTGDWLDLDKVERVCRIAFGE